MPTKTPKRRLKAARLVIYERHGELTMLGFELEDLDEVKERVSMRWDRDDKVWLIHKREIDTAIEALEDLNFIIRIKDERDDY